MPTSFNPETFTSGLSEGVVTITAAHFEERESDWGDQVVMVIEMTDADDKPHQKFYNVGKTEFVQVTDDGQAIDSIDEDSEYAISGRSGAGKFFAALCSAGFDASLLNDGRIDVLVGLNLEVATQESGTKKLDGTPNTILLPVKVLGGGKVKGDKKKKSSGSAAPPAKKSKTSTSTKSSKPAAEEEEDEEEEEEEEEEGDSLRDEAVELFTRFLTEADDNSLTVKQLTAEVFTHMKKDKRKSDFVALAVDTEFLEENWTYDAKKKIVSLA